MSTAKPKIAIIEDDMPIVQMYRSKFEHEGYVVQTAGDGQSGLAMIERFEPDVVLLDLMMPGMTGTDMLMKAQKLPAAKKAKIIVLTNMGDSEMISQLYKLGASDFIVKADMTPSQVTLRVRKALED